MSPSFLKEFKQESHEIQQWEALSPSSGEKRIHALVHAGHHMAGREKDLGVLVSTKAEQRFMCPKAASRLREKQSQRKFFPHHTALGYHGWSYVSGAGQGGQGLSRVSPAKDFI